MRVGIAEALEVVPVAVLVVGVLPVGATGTETGAATGIPTGTGTLEPVGEGCDPGLIFDRLTGFRAGLVPGALTGVLPVPVFGGRGFG